MTSNKRGQLGKAIYLTLPVMIVFQILQAKPVSTISPDIRTHHGTSCNSSCFSFLHVSRDVYWNTCPPGITDLQNRLQLYQPFLLPFQKYNYDLRFHHFAKRMALPVTDGFHKLIS